VLRAPDYVTCAPLVRGAAPPRTVLSSWLSALIPTALLPAGDGVCVFVCACVCMRI